MRKDYGALMTGYESLSTNGAFVAVAGNIAVGKSGLVRSLATALGGEALTEEVQTNPFFERFYESPEQWAFQSQTAFTVDALRRQSNAPASRTVVQDRTAYESIDVFCKVLHREGYLADNDLLVFDGLRDVALSLPRQPTLLIYLHAPTEVLKDRIARRDRTAEQKITAAYLELLNAQYERFLSTWDLCPVLSVDTQQHDLRKPDELAWMVSTIEQS